MTSLPTVLRPLQQRALRWIKTRRYTPFVVIGAPRSGNNLLASCLNSHPRVCLESELLEHLRGRSAKEAVEEIFAPSPLINRAVGFRFFYDHPRDTGREETRQRLRSIPGLRVIHLQRRNRVRVFVSLMLAHQNSVWVEHGENDRNSLSSKKVTLNSADFFIMLNMFDVSKRNCLKPFVDCPVHEVWYEDLVASPGETLESLQRFLGVEPRLLTTGTKRINPEPLSELIANYDDVRRHFQNTEWDWCFDEEPRP